MGTIARSYDGVPGEAANINALESDINALYTLVNGYLDKDNIAANAIEASQIAADAVVAAKIADANILEAAIQWASASAGVEAWRTGPNYVGANGGRIARISIATTTAVSVTTETFAVTFATACEDGDPAFSATPIAMGMPVFISAGADDNMPTQTYFTAMASTSCTVRVVYAASSATGVAATVDFCVAGPA